MFACLHRISISTKRAPVHYNVCILGTQKLPPNLGNTQTDVRPACRLGTPKNVYSYIHESMCVRPRAHRHSRTGCALIVVNLQSKMPHPILLEAVMFRTNILRALGV